MFEFVYCCSMVFFWLDFSGFLFELDSKNRENGIFNKKNINSVKFILIFGFFLLLII